ncbi:hypothetical protein SAMN05216176_105303 [Nitratireductor indicus]|nr:hypothetical protein SAMN05216176_105303 [Nitratireductor indicus]
MPQTGLAKYQPLLSIPQAHHTGTNTAAKLGPSYQHQCREMLR